ncbi:hypothetical protein [Pontibacter ruber]|uniref:Uncharacterized protein n=1 Tax=Pontibacter ruber TaxID=1343895 RepID=A0ABW5CZG8_9BACT|nr:hypothetical protein [Pontibacter ruber]
MNLLLDTLLVAQDTIAAAKILPHDIVVVDSLALSKQTIKDIAEATKDEPSWTDKVQAYSALAGIVVGVIAGLLAWLSYRSTIRQQQDQINDQQQEINSLAVIADRLEAQVNLGKEKRRNEIKPYLRLKESFSPYTIDSSKLSLLKTVKDVEVECQRLNFFLNVEKNPAFNVRLVDPINPIIIKAFVDFPESKEIRVGSFLVTLYINKDVDLRTADYSLLFQYKDIDGNEYLQEAFSKPPRSNPRVQAFEFDNPVLLKAVTVSV